MLDYLHFFFMLLELGVLFFIILALIIKIRDSIILRVPFITTRDNALKLAIKEMQLKNDSVLYDLGCGDGRILVKAIENNPGAKGVGVEKGIVPFLIALIKTRKLPIAIVYGDIFHIDLSPATHIYCYLHHSVMKKLEEKIAKECKKGTRIIVNDYPFTGLNMEKKIIVPMDGSPLSRTLYMYTL